MANILIMRFSALGDVAMTIPVIYSFASKYKNHNIWVLSQTNLKSMFDLAPENVHFIEADFKSKHKGVKGLNTLFLELKKYNFDFIADFHSVLRSHYLRLRFQLAGIPTKKIKKGRCEKSKLIRRNNKHLFQLKSSFERYHDVLQSLGFEFELNFESIYENNVITDLHLSSNYTKVSTDKWLGIAPFAKHKGKIYPLELQLKVIEHFANKKDVKVFIFGGGKEEKIIIDSWIERFPNIESSIGKLNMSQEIALMSQLDVMYSMDSANMHLASLANTAVVSLWGATHPFAGFMGWNQPATNAVQIDLPCRPCSIYGNKPCYRKDYACLNQIEPIKIIRAIEKLLY